MRSVQESAMQDECIILIYSDTTNEDGHPAPGYTPGATLMCGLETDPSRVREVMDNTELVTVDARLRLPLSAETQVKATDRIKIMKRFGTTLITQAIYSIIGVPVRGPSGIRINLKLVTE